MSIAEPIRSHGGVAQALRRTAPGSVIREHEPLSKHTTMRIGGPADIYIEPATEAELEAALEVCRERSTPWMVIGRGSNLLVRDGGVRGVVICLSSAAFSAIRVEDERIHCGAGARLRALAVEAKRAALGGFEFMEGIPGNVGGALRMNAGAMSSSTFEVVESVRVMDPEGGIQELRVEEIPVEYRNCPLFKTRIALSATFRGQPKPRAFIEQKMIECSRKRWKSQPAAPSAGCIFKNPLTAPTGRLVEELGLKGVKRGGAAISEVHGNFIVNEGNARAAEVLELIELIRERARSVRGIELQTEVQIVGED